MNTNDDLQLKLIEKIFNRFLIQTQSDSPQLSRDYFERFTQLLNQTFEKYPQLKPLIETMISSIIYPYHSSNGVTFEYQLRLIRFSLRQHLQILELNKTNYLHELFDHKLLISSSIVRHLSLQIALLIYEHDFHQSFDNIFFSHIIQLFSSDPNLYVRNTLAQFLSLYISKHDQYQLLHQIQEQSSNSDLIYNILILFDQDKQQLLIKQMNIYENLLDSTATRIFALKTGRHLIDEEQIVFFLNRILEKSLSDYVHILLTIISSRYENQRSINKLNACLKGLFLYSKEIDIEEIDENEHNMNEGDELTEYICCQLYERNIQSIDVASILIDTIQPFIINSNSFIYKLDFYSLTILTMLAEENHPDKVFAQLIKCYEKLQEFNFLTNITDNLYNIIINHVKNKKRTTFVYQSLFNLILHATNRKDYLESIYSIIEVLLFRDTDKLLQWDDQDCVLHFLIELIKLNNIRQHNEYPSWLTNQLVQRIIEKFVHNNNEYIQGSLIDFLAAFVEYDFVSPLDDYLTTNFIQLTQCSLGDVVRCALAHAWYVILMKATEKNINETKVKNYQFSFGLNTNFDSLLNIVINQIPLLIGDGGQETEIRCLRLIEFIGRKDKGLEDILDFLISDGCSNEIKEKACQLRSVSIDKFMKKKNDELLEDELSSILHWLEHPDEHMILDCD